MFKTQHTAPVLGELDKRPKALWQSAREQAWRDRLGDLGPTKSSIPVKIRPEFDIN